MGPGVYGPRDVRRARYAVAAVFAVHGAVTGSFATRVPWIQDHAGVSAGQLGLALAFPALISGIVPSETLVRTMASFGFFAPGPLRPIVTISYDRYRFVEPRTGFRVSLDSHITSTMVVPGAGIAAFRNSLILMH